MINDLEKKVIKRNDKELIDFVNILSYSQICMEKNMGNFNYIIEDNFTIDGPTEGELFSKAERPSCKTPSKIVTILKDLNTLNFIKGLTIFYDGFSSMNWLKLLPSLKKIKLIINKHEMPSIPIILNTYKHNIKHIIVQYSRHCPYPNIDLLDTYCHDNNIRFEKEIT